jgi:PIN domain nuclease of toxin-antitoxin system
MKKYLLDTHIIIWLLRNSSELDKNVREDIEFFQNTYFASVESLREILILQSLNKIELKDNLEKIIADLENRQISVLPIELKHIKELEKLPVYKENNNQHNDPFDRMLISQAIAEKITIISADKKFPFYKKLGLKLLVNE